MTIHHLALGARDVARVAAFYARHFGLTELKRHFYDGGALRSVWLDLAPGILMVEHSERTRQPVEGVDAGLFLISFMVEDPEKRGALEGRLEEEGVSIEERTGYTSYARDPEGNRFAFSQPLPRSIFE